MPNNNKQMVDLPYFELCNQAPSASSSIGCMTTAEEGNDRYIYMITGALFYRYDTFADTWQQLASPNITPAGTSSLRYTRRRGYHAYVLSATSTTITMAAPRGASLNGETLRVLAGAGAGQERVLSLLSEAVHDAGTFTTASSSGPSDSTKKWRINQWAGYMLAVTMGPALPQYKRIVANDATTLYVQVVGLEPHEPWANQPFATIAPYALPAVVGAQYQIMSSTFAVNAWATLPAERDFCTALSGGIYLQSGLLAAPFLSMQYYDVAADIWQTKTVPQGLQAAAIALDSGIERTAKTGAVYVTGTATSTAQRTLTDAALNLESGRYANHRVLITGGTGAGQSRRIVTNTATTFTVPRNWDVQPNATSTYEVWPDFDRVYFSGSGNASMLAYSPENDFWMQGQSFDDGVTSTITCTLASEMPVGVSTGVRIAAGIRSINAVPTAGGANYILGDVLTCTVGGIGAQVRVTSVGAGGSVTGLELHNAGTGTGYAIGTGRATTGSTGTGCTFEITTVGATALISTSTLNKFKLGHTVTFAGCTEAAWNAAHVIIGVSTTSMFSVAVSATANMASAQIQSTTLIVDASKNWIVNEHVGRLVHLMVSGTSPTSQVRWIVSNTANTLTVATITAAANGTSKYAIYDSKIFGIDDQRKEQGMGGWGFATGGSTTTLVDSNKNWDINVWAGYSFKIEAGPGYGSGRITVISNTANSLTYATQTFTPTDDTFYEIADAWGLATSGGLNTITDTTKKWASNQWINKRVRFTGGMPGMSVFENTVTGNTLNLLSVPIGTGTTDATSTYAILSIPPRGTGTALLWVWGATDPKKRGRYMYSPRGGASTAIDVYDIVTQRWAIGWNYRGSTELFTTGSSYTYNGADSLFLSRSAVNGPIRIFLYNINIDRMDGLATTTVLQNAVHIGNYMETVDSPDGYQYLYTLQNSGTLLMRALIS